MQRFKVSVSKDQKRYTLILRAENERQVRERVHDEGYSILTVEEVSDETVEGNKFVFEAITSQREHKNGKVIGDDIFKIYLKLRRDLGYEVLKLHSESEANITHEASQKILHELNEEYTLFINKNSKKENLKNKEVATDSEGKLKDFYLKKELDETYKLIDFVLDKLSKLLGDQEVKNISNDQKEKLKKVYNSIIKIKKTTNISKLKEIGELALLKIGSIELRSLENTKDGETKEYLKETNKLLKKMGSSKQFIEKDKDIGYILKTWIEGIVYFVSGVFKKSHKNEIDKNSYSYIRNILVFEKYNARLKENTKKIFKNIHCFIFPVGKLLDKKEDILLERKVLQQNILLLKVKISGKSFSYARMKSSSTKFFTIFLNKIKSLRRYTSIIIFLYSVIFITYFIYSYYFPVVILNYKGLYYLIILLLFHIGLYASRTFFTLLLNFVFLYFIIIFGMVNF